MVGIEEEREAGRRATLDHLRSKTFHKAIFEERRFNDTHYHCRACGKIIAEESDARADHVGYITITRTKYEGLPVSHQYAWICLDCFPKYQNEFDWRISDDDAPLIPEEARREFFLAYRKYLQELPNTKRPQREPAYAVASWTPPDVTAIAHQLGLELNERDAEEFLIFNEHHIQSVMTGHGLQLIRELLLNKKNALG